MDSKNNNLFVRMHFSLNNKYHMLDRFDNFCNNLINIKVELIKIQR